MALRDKNGDVMMDMDEALEKALQRVVNKENLKYVPQLEQVLTLARQKERILAAEILADKELHSPCEGETATGEEEQMDLKIDSMEKALLNHRIVKSALQSVAINIQLQDTVRDIMQKTDVEETMDQLPERGLILSHCSNNLHTCKELASVIEQKSNLEKEIRKLELKYSSLLTVLREKWILLQDKAKQPVGDNKRLLNLQNKMKEREGKIQILVTMIQGLIASSSFLWGASNYFLQVMMLCDSVTRNLDIAKQDNIMKEIAKIHEEREEKENRSVSRQTLITESMTKLN